MWKWLKFGKAPQDAETLHDLSIISAPARSETLGPVRYLTLFVDESIRLNDFIMNDADLDKLLPTFLQNVPIDLDDLKSRQVPITYARIRKLTGQLTAERVFSAEFIGRFTKTHVPITGVLAIAQYSVPPVASHKFAGAVVATWQGREDRVQIPRQRVVWFGSESSLAPASLRKSSDENIDLDDSSTASAFSPEEVRYYRFRYVQRHTGRVIDAEQLNPIVTRLRDSLVPLVHLEGAISVVKHADSLVLWLATGYGMTGDKAHSTVMSLKAAVDKAL